MQKLHRDTLLVHAGTARSQFGELSEALFLTQGFVYNTPEEAEARFENCPEGEFIYARYGNPTVRMFEQRIAMLEGAEDAFATASGMAAVSGTLMSILKSGDHVVSAQELFGSCRFVLEDVLSKWGVSVTFVPGNDLEAWRNATRENTKVFFFESIANPTLRVIDIPAVSEIAATVGAIVVADNVFATPLFQRPLELGADVVIYSATKHIDGQGRCLGGVVLSTTQFIRKTLEPFLKHTGAALSPFNAWVMLKGMETLSLRCNAQANSALKIAGHFRDHPKLSHVHYPHLENHADFDLATHQLEKGGTVVSMEVIGGKEKAFKMLNALSVILISNNLGDAKSIVTHPATTTHQRLTPEDRAVLGISDGFLRFSIGLEHVDDLVLDIENALSEV
jgi:O-succinylhomoserine sulfhydrylase